MTGKISRHPQEYGSLILYGKIVGVEGLNLLYEEIHVAAHKDGTVGTDGTGEEEVERNAQGRIVHGVG